MYVLEETYSALRLTKAYQGSIWDSLLWIRLYMLTFVLYKTFSNAIWFQDSSFECSAQASLKDSIQNIDSDWLQSAHWGEKYFIFRHI